MTLEFPSIIYAGMLVFFSLAFVFHLSGQTKPAGMLFIPGFIVSCAGVAGMVVNESRLPLFGPFESVLSLVFYLGLFTLLNRNPCIPARTLAAIDRAAMAAILILLAIQAANPMELNSDFYMYDNLWVNLFFLLRLAATALFIYAGLVLCTSAWVKRLRPLPSDMSGHLGRNFLLSGIAAFLCAEWSGSFWCLNWLGDTWQWSRGFFRGSAVFLLVMLACHLPPYLARSNWARALFGSLPGLFCLWMIFFR